MDAADILIGIRQSIGLSRGDVAALADVAPSTIGRIENRQLDPRWSTLSRILAATGSGLDRGMPVSAGDATAPAAARAAFEGRLDPDNVWSKRWTRVGWVDQFGRVTNAPLLGVFAGVAGMFARRRDYMPFVGDRRDWQTVARALEWAGEPYAVGGLVVIEENRENAADMEPVIYVNNAYSLAQELAVIWPAGTKGRVRLVSAKLGEMDGAERDNEFVFATRAQGIMDALCSGGRQPNKAERATYDLKVAA